MSYGTIEENIGWAKRSWIKSIKYDFPDEKMGLGDKLILRRVLEERVTHFIESFPDISPACAYFFLDVDLEMEKYGFKVKQSLGNFTGW